MAARSPSLVEDPSLEMQFESFAKFGDTRADGRTITLSSIDKWLKQAGIFTKTLTTTDTAITFNKFKSKVIGYDDFLKFVEDLADQKRIPTDQIKEKLVTCGAPGLNKATQAVKTGAVDRLTDTSKYTGSHKERFDESGKGKGIEGREYLADDSGYVNGYKGQGTYDNHNTTSFNIYEPPLSKFTVRNLHSFYMAAGNVPLDQQFINFAKFGDTKADGKTITLSQIDKWMKQAGAIDKTLTTTDTAICFNKFKSKTIHYSDFVKFIDDLASQKKMPSENIKEKLETCGLPGTNKATQAVKTGAVDRLTDTSKYTGSHKERFDESGKGKGAAGREDLHDDTGYVGGYKGQGTYDKK